MYPLNQAIRKYGLKNFILTILEECSEEQLNERELYFYNKIKPEYCLLAPNESPLHHKETRLKISQKLTGRKLSSKHVNKLRMANLGAKNPMACKVKGVHKHTGEIIIFDSHSLAGIFVVKKGLAKTKPRYAEQTIWKAIHGTRKSAYGYIWTHI